MDNRRGGLNMTEKINIKQFIAMGIEGEYYVSYNFDIDTESGIAEMLRIPVEDYINILKKYGAYQNVLYWFVFKEDCEKCAEYLNNTYGILLALEE
jgi:hypothetical protein